MMQKIRNIIFDLGGVLADLDEQRCIAAFEAVGLHGITDYVREHRTEDMFWNIEIGLSTTSEFCDEVRRVSGTQVSDERIVWAWNQLITGIPEARLKRLVALRAHYRLFLLSNTNAMHWKLCRRFLNGQGYTVGDCFDRVFLSYEMRLAKPSPEIFRHVLAEAGIRAEETLFIDDSAANCLAAEDLGILTWHQTAETNWMTRL